MAQTKYSIADFSVVIAQLENLGYAVDPSSPAKVIPIYDVDVPLQHEQAFETIRYLSGTLGAIGGYPVEAFKRWQFTTYVYNTGDRDNLPPWADILLPASGFHKSKINGAAPTGTFTVADSGSSGVLSGTYFYRATLVKADQSLTNIGLDSDDRDETVSALLNSSGTTVTNKRINITLPTPPSGQFYRLYRAKTNSSNPFYWIADLDVGQNTFTDNIPDDNVDKTRTAPISGTNGDEKKTIFSPTSVDHWSVRAEIYLNSYRSIVRGSRGTWTLEANYGRAMAMRWDMQGIYTQSEETAAANPSTSALGPGMPYRFVGADVKIFPTKRTGISSVSGSYVGENTGGIVVKRLTITPGTQVAVRGDATHASGVRELGIHQTYQPSVSMVVEVERSFDWKPVRDYNEGVDFGISVRVKQGSTEAESIGKSCRFIFPNCQISDAPRHTREDNGILCWEITFTPKNIHRNDWMLIELG